MSTQTIGQVTAFGRYMKQWRRQRGLSQLDLAVRADVSQRHVSFIETGRSRPREDVVLKVAEALEVPLRDRNILLVLRGMGLHSMVELARVLMINELADERWAMIAAVRSQEELDDTIAVLRQREIAENTKLCRSNP